jgi:2-oxoisovalerate dehydrogenase E2 component (dihydrolipoyl transacylase)
MMSTHTVKMPDLGEGITEVEVVAWHVQVGDAVTEDQVLADVMTDKATVEIPSPVAGTVARLGGDVGEVLAVGAPLIDIAVDGYAGASEEPAPAPQRPATAAASTGSKHRDDDKPAPDAARTPGHSSASPSGVSSPSASVVADATRASADTGDEVRLRIRADAPDRLAKAGVSDTAVSLRDERPIASPALRRRAWELGVDLHRVSATGSGGRIMQADLDAHVAQHGAPGPQATAPVSATPSGCPGVDETRDIKVIGLRRRIAQKMQESKRRIPHFAYVEECDVTALEALRAQLNTRFGATRGKLTLLPFLVRAMVLAAAEFPQVNALFDDATGVVTRHSAVHMGIATQTDAGLMVPVLRHAQDGDLWAHARAIARLAEMTRAGKATRDELTGSTLTLTSLGALGGIVSTPIINAPEVAIVGVNRIVERPMVVDGGFVARKMMNLSSSFDHRVVDGQDAARFIQAMRGLLESPAALLVA